MDLFNDIFDNQSPNQLPIDQSIKNGQFMNTDFTAYLHDDGKGVVIVVPFGRLYYSPCYFDKKFCDDYLAYLLADGNINWQQDTIYMYGKTHPIPRLSHGMAIRIVLMRIRALALCQILGRMSYLPSIRRYLMFVKGDLIACC